jgi:hypothetical protein
MAMTRIFKFDDLTDLQNFLNGGITGCDVSKGVGGLVGQTLTFTSPADSVTFVGPTLPGGSERDPTVLLFGDIKEQIEAAVPSLVVASNKGRIVLLEATPANGVALSDNDEAAKALLGFGAEKAVGTFYQPGTGAGSRYSSIIAVGNAFLVTTFG